MKPLLKWPGGKAKLAPLISETFGEPCYGTYFEPFLGSGAVYLHRKAAGEIRGEVTLSDINPKLVNFHRMVKLYPGSFIKALHGLPKGTFREDYYEVRNRFNDPDAIERDAVGHAAMLLWLNKTCFNGLYRENRQGEFNVSLGSYKTLNLPSDQEILEVSEALQGVKLLCLPFVVVLQKGAPEKGDQIYCDPPYDAGFASYSKGGFNREDHAALAAECETAAAEGAKIVLSNIDNSFTRELYFEEDGWSLRSISVSRSISCNGNRDKQKEILATLNINEEP